MLTITYKKNDAGFIQGFLINQNGQPFNLANITGTLKVTWWFRKDDETQATKFLDWTGSYSGANNNKVQFAIPTNFFNEVVTYDCELAVYNDSTFLMHTRPSFLVKIEETAGDKSS